MKKSIIFKLVIFLILSICTSVNAANNANVTLKSNSNQIKQGESFKVILSVNSEKGINAINTTYTYDTSSLELIKAQLVDTEKWVDFSRTGSLTIFCNSTSKITSADIYEFTFKVKENASVGAVAKVNTGKILVDTDEATNSQIEIEAKNISITVLTKQTPSDEEDNKDDETEPEQKPGEDNKDDETEPEQKPGEDNKDDETEPEQKPEEDNKDDETEPEQKPEEDNKDDETKPEQKPEDDNKDDETKPEQKPEENNNDKNVSTEKNEIDGTIANGKLPQTGNDILPIILITIFISIGISTFVAYKKYKKV